MAEGEYAADIVSKSFLKRISKKAVPSGYEEQAINMIQDIRAETRKEAMKIIREVLTEEIKEETSKLK